MALLFGVNVGSIPSLRKDLPYCSRKDYDSNTIWTEMLSSQIRQYGLIAFTRYAEEPDGLKGDEVFNPSKVYVGLLFDTDPRSNPEAVKNLKGLTNALANPDEVQKKLKQAGLNVELSEICLYVL